MSSEDFSAHCRCGGVISYVNTLKCLISLYQEAPSEICSDYKPRRDIDSSQHEGLYLLTLFKAFLVLNSVCLPHLSKGFCPTRDWRHKRDFGARCCWMHHRCCQMWVIVSVMAYYCIQHLQTHLWIHNHVQVKILSTCLATLCSCWNQK
jgi:hypothetical protein